MKKSMSVILVILLCAGITSASTVAYWSLDGAAYDGTDAVGTNHLTIQGTLQDSNLRMDPVPNPDISTPWNSPNSAAANPKANWFSQDCLYIPNSSVEADHDSTFDLDPTKSFTVEGWFSLYGTSGTIIGNRHSSAASHMYGGSYKGWAVYYTSGDGKLNFWTDGAAAAGSSVNLTAPVTVGQLTHFAAVMDVAADLLKLYINGGLVVSAAIPDAWSHHRGGALAIGARDAGTGFNSLVFAGGIDELRYVDMALDSKYFLNGDTPLPEPGTMSLLGLGVLAILKRRNG